MGNLIEKATGKVWDIPPDEMQSALASGLYDAPEGATTTIVEEGLASEIPVAELEAQLERGAVAESSEELAARHRASRIDREHGGISDRVIGGVESFAGTATFGGTDYLAGAIGGDEYKEARAGRREASPTQTMITDVAGLVVPTLLTGGTGGLGALARATPTALATKAGLAVGKKSLIKGMALEGGLQGLGQTLHEEALNTDPFEMETFASNLQSNVLWGTATGGLVGGAAKAGQVFIKAANKGVLRAKGLADDLASKARGGSAVADDLARMDMPALKAAKETEHVAAGSRLMDEAAAYHKASEALDPLLLATGDTAKALNKAKAARSTLLKKQLTLAEEGAAGARVVGAKSALKPGAMLKSLKGEEQALLEIMKSSEELLSAGKLNVPKAKVLEGIPDLIRSNAAAQKGLVALTKGTTPEIAAITNAMDVLSAGGAKKGGIQKFVEAGVQGASTAVMAPAVGFWAAGAASGKIADAVGDLIFRRGAKAAAEGGKRTAQALDMLMDTGAKVGKLAPPLATKVLAGTSYGQLLKDGLSEKEPKTLGEHYKAREREIQSKVQMGPNGPTMRPAARQELGARLDGVRMASPALADHIETLANRKISFLSAKLPKKPDFMQHASGPDSYQPSNMAMRTWARYMAAVEDPAAVEERLADGSLSPEDAEAYRTVYPERYAALQRSIVERLPELRANLPYAKRLSLSIFSGVAVDPALDHRIFRQYQRQFTGEPGSEGGTQAPEPKPQFGSVKAPENTPAQERAG